MYKYSSDSDSQTVKRINKKSYLRAIQDSSSSSELSSSRIKRRKNKKHRGDSSRSKGNDTFSKFRNERRNSRHNTTYHCRKSSRSSNSPERPNRSSKDQYKTKYNKSKSSSTRSRSISRSRRLKTRKSESRDSSRQRERSDNSSSSNSFCEKNISHRFKEIDADKVIESVEQIKSKLKKVITNKDNTKINVDVLDEINDDTFVPKQFVSANISKKMTCNIVIDLKSQTIKIPDVEITEPDSIFHPNLFMNEETRIEKWVKELYVYRQKTILNANQDWPVPQYFGACGRVIIEEYCGRSLNSIKDESWIIRASVAMDLLKAAYNFTNKHPAFRFYLTDISSDNIAVTEEYKIKFIDLENMIITEKHSSFVKLSSHESHNFDCESCYAFSQDDICSHGISDHNYYSVCKLLLSVKAPWPMMTYGLLHSPPKHIQQKYPDVFSLIEICADSSENIKRSEATERLLNILQLIIENE